MIASGAVSVRLLHPHRRVTPRHAQHLDFAGALFAALLEEHNMKASMGRTGVCWDNAMAASFFGALKSGLVYRHVFPTRERARSAIAECIEVFYNRQRLHSGLGYKTPLEVLQQHQQNPALAA